MAKQHPYDDFSNVLFNTLSNSKVFMFAKNCQRKSKIIELPSGIV